METPNYFSDKLKRALSDAHEFINKKCMFSDLTQKKEINDRFLIFEFFEKKDPIRKISIIWDKVKEEWRNHSNSIHKGDSIENSLIDGAYEDIVTQSNELFFFFKNKVTKIYQMCIYEEKIDFEEMALPC